MSPLPAAATCSTEWRWEMRRNCRLTPRQLLAGYAALCGFHAVLSLLFWRWGVPLVAPFAALEMMALGAALLAYARHAADRECIVLQPGRLVVEQQVGARLHRTEFDTAWVRVQPPRGPRELLTLAGPGVELRLGRHVRAPLRRAVALELRQALARLERAALG